MIYAIWNTIFVNCYSIRNFKVPMELLELELNEEDIECIGYPTENLKMADVSTIYSPRSRNNGESFYLCSNNVAWIYKNQEHGNDFMAEYDFLYSYGLRVGRDMVLVNTRNSLSSMSFILSSMGCDWLKVVDRGLGYLKISVNEDKLYKGLQTRAIRK